MSTSRMPQPRSSTTGLAVGRPAAGAEPAGDTADHHAGVRRLPVDRRHQRRGDHPAGYAFSIWGLITLLCAVTCVAVVRLGLGAPWESRLLVDASVVFVGFSAWLLVAAQDWTWLSVAVFAVMVAALVDAMRLLVRHADDLTAPRGCGV